ncbi:hypothetical protein [Pseudomonas putida]
MATKSEILTWMSKQPRTLEWGMIVVVDRAKINKLLAQVYIEKFNSTSFLPPISGVIEASAGEYRYLIESFSMDMPRLSFETANLNDSKARLNMKVLGGNQITEKYINQQWRTQSIEWIGPMQGPELSLNLMLPDTPVYVSEGGGLNIDLKDSDDFSLNFTESEQDQKLGGDFFKELFRRLEDDQRVYPLGKIERGPDSFTRPNSFKLRTQRNPQPGEEANGAVLCFVQMEGADQGSIPIEGSDFPYLLADETSASVLFDRRYVYIPATADTFLKVFHGNNKQFITDSKGRPIGLTLTSGSLEVKPAAFKTLTDVGELVPTIAKMDWSVSNAVIQGGQSIRIEMSDSGMSVKGLSVNLPMKVSFVNFDGTAWFRSWMIRGSEVEKKVFKKLEVPIEFSVSGAVSVEYSHTTGRPVVSIGGSRLQAADMRRLDAPAPVENTRATTAEDKPDETHIYKAIVNNLNEWQESGYFYEQCEKSVTSSLTYSLNLNVNHYDYLSKLLKLNFGESIVGQSAYMPRDGVLFGDINPVLTSFTVAPLEITLAHGQTHQFSVEPVTAVEWALDDPAKSGNLGSITQSGLYTAPDAGNFEGLFTRVRVVAKNPTTGYRSSALITVLKQSLSINPLVDTTGGATRILKAGSLGVSGDSLTWSIKQSGTQGTLSSTTGAQVIYTPGTNFGDDEDVIFVVDEITVSNGQDSATTYIVNRNSDPLNVIDVREVDAVNRIAKLQATVRNKDYDSKWTILVGTGLVDEATGRYTADKESPARFVLLQSAYDSGVLGIFYGYVILPLPLSAQQRSLPGTVQVSSAGEILHEVRPMS